MGSPLKPLKLYGTAQHPNPAKVLIVLKELGLPFEREPIPMNQVKGPEFLKLNPNGRLPALYDPNRDITLWESGAIIQYIVDEYDREHKLSFSAGTPEYYHANQWLMFQMSGQGPYYGQLFWFCRYHSEKIPSAIDRYTKEVLRVSSVLDSWLADKEYLVGNRLSYADLAFVVWQQIVPVAVGDAYDLDKEFPNLAAWKARLEARPSVAAVTKERNEIFSEEAKQK